MQLKVVSLKHSTTCYYSTFWIVFNKLFLSVTGKTNSAFLWGEKKFRTLMRGFLQFSLLDKCTLNLTDSLCLKNFIYASKMIGCSKFLWRQGGGISDLKVFAIWRCWNISQICTTHIREPILHIKKSESSFQIQIESKKSVWHLSLL